MGAFKYLKLSLVGLVLLFIVVGPTWGKYVDESRSIVKQIIETTADTDADVEPSVLILGVEDNERRVHGKCKDRGERCDPFRQGECCHRDICQKFCIDDRCFGYYCNHPY